MAPKFYSVLNSSAVRYATHSSHRRAVQFLAVFFVWAGLLLPSGANASDDMHVVSRGERLSDIARIYNVGLDELIEVNAINDPSVIVPGQRLIIPGTKLANPYGAPAESRLLPGSNGYHTVQRGDALTVIANSYGMSLDDLMRLNGIAHPRNIWVGQDLRVTARVEPVDAQAAAELQPANAIHIVRTGETMSEIARDYGTTLEELLVANGLPSTRFVFSGQRLRVPVSAGADNTLAIAGAPENGERRIEVDLSQQMLSAYQGDVRVFRTSVSTGKENTPTVTGTFEVGTKYEKQHMWGDDYDLPNVPWVMYFQGAYAIHGAYWHTNFGTPASHGCVNMRPEEAELLFRWASAGTEVVVYE